MSHTSILFLKWRLKVVFLWPPSRLCFAVCCLRAHIPTCLCFRVRFQCPDLKQASEIPAKVWIIDWFLCECDNSERRSLASSDGRPYHDDLYRFPHRWVIELCTH